MGQFYESSLAVVPKPVPEQAKGGSFWLKEVPVLNTETRGIVRGGMWVPQREWWDLKNFIKVMVGGFGSGKTMIGCKRAISLALQNAPVPISIVSPSFPLARRTVIATLVELLAGKERLLGRHQFWFRVHRNPLEIYIQYHGRRGTIYIHSGEDPLSLRGPNIAAALIDEPFIQDEDVFKQMIARVRHPDAVKSEVCLMGTPEQLNWGYELCLGDKKDQHDVGFVQASTRSNLALPENYVGRLEGAYTGLAAEAYIEGNFKNLSTGTVYYGFNPTEEGNYKTLPIPDNAELGVGMDFNVNPMSAAVFWRAGSHMHYFDEIELPNADTEYMCSLLRARYVDHPDFKHRALRYIYPDATGSARKTSAPGGKSDFSYIRAAGFSIRANHENPKRRDRYNAVNGKFKPLKGDPTLTIDPKCKQLKRYLMTYTHELMNQQQEMSHLLDAFGYPVAYLFPVSRESLTIGKLQGH